MANARRVLSWAPRHEKQVFVERVDFITGVESEVVIQNTGFGCAS